MTNNDDSILSTEGLELHRYTNESGEFCVDATLGAESDRPTHTMRFKRGSEICVQKTDGEFLYGEIVGPPVFNDDAKSDDFIDHFKSLADDPNRTIIVDVTHVTVAGSKLPQLTPQQVMVDPTETETFQERLEAFIRERDMRDYPMPEANEMDEGAESAYFRDPV